MELLIGWVFLISLGPLFELRSWNRGICRKTGKPWNFVFDGARCGRLYRSEDHDLWITWF